MAELTDSDERTTAMPDLNNDTAIVLPLAAAMRRWSVDEQSGDIFDIDEEFSGVVLTIELLDEAEARAVATSLLAQLGGVE